MKDGEDTAVWQLRVKRRRLAAGKAREARMQDKAQKERACRQVTSMVMACEDKQHQKQWRKVGRSLKQLEVAVLA